MDAPQTNVDGDDPDAVPEQPIGRRERRRLESRQAILNAAAQVMAAKGIESATMAEISEQADVALGSLYNHFDSKQDLAIAVVDAEIGRLAKRIDEASTSFGDPAVVFAFGCQTVMQHATQNDQWRHLLASPGVIAESICNGFGPFAKRDLERAVAAGRLEVADIEVAWRLTSWVIVGYASAVCRAQISESALPTTVAAVLGLAGMDGIEAHRLVTDLPRGID